MLGYCVASQRVSSLRQKCFCKSFLFFSLQIWFCAIRTRDELGLLDLLDTAVSCRDVLPTVPLLEADGEERHTSDFRRFLYSLQRCHSP